jgi:hypothetical protein
MELMSCVSSSLRGVITEGKYRSVNNFIFLFSGFFIEAKTWMKTSMVIMTSENPHFCWYSEQYSSYFL